jgi:hypothetical protein
VASAAGDTASATVGGRRIHVRLTVLVADVPRASVTVTVTLVGDGVVGVPLMTPAADIVSPSGSEPVLHVYGALPPEPCRVAE